MSRLNGKSYAFLLGIHKALYEGKKVNIFFNNNSTLIFTIDMLMKLGHTRDKIEIYYGNEIAKELGLQLCKHKSQKKSTIIYGCKAYPVLSNFHISNNNNRLTNIIIDDYNNYDNNRTSKESFGKSLG